MDKFKKVSLIFVFAIALLASFFGLSNKISTNLEVYADNEKIVLNVKKVKYSNSNIIKTNENGEPLTDDDGNSIPKMLGEYTAQELYDNKDAIMENSTDIVSGDVVSLKSSENEAVFVLLSPSDNTSLIKLLSPSLTVSCGGKRYNALIDSYKINENYENRVFVMALDFNKLVDDLGLEFDYSTGAHFSFAFNYSYTTNATNTISESKEFDFYLINHSNFFEGDNKYQIQNCQKQILDSEEYFYNKATKENASLKFNPYKFSPKIVYTYNEMQVNLFVEYNTQNKTFALKSDNQNIFEDKNLNIFDAETGKTYVEIELSRIGKYEVNYDIVIFGQDGINIVDNSKTHSIQDMQTQTIYYFGYEALHKNYSETDSEIKAQNQDYKPLFNENFESDFSYDNDLLDNDNKPNIDKITSKLNSNINFVSKIAKTNQAPVKINSYVTELVNSAPDKAEYYILNKNSSGIYSYEQPYSFNQSKRFETSGLYVVLIPYKFETFNDNLCYKIIIFKIENTTPEINFYSDENFSSLINANGFTNSSVYVAFNKESNDPFSLPNKIKFVKNNSVLVEGKDYKIIKTNNKYDYVWFDANSENSNGTYLVQLTYGTSDISVEKKFVIDTSKIEFKVVDVKKDENSKGYDIISDSDVLNNINETNNSKILNAETNNNFAIFVKNKNVNNNLISVKYDYVALNNEQSSKLYEIVEETVDGKTQTKLVIYNNYQLNNIYSDLTYSNLTINNLTDFSNISIASNNTNAVLSISALYRFVISDLAGNKQVFYVLQDNTKNVVLESNEKVEVSKIGEEYKLVYSQSTGEIKEATLNIKNDELNLVSNNYSLIFGDYKALKFKIDDNNKTLAQEYFDNENLASGDIEKILRPNEKINISRNILGNFSEAEKTEINNYLNGIETKDTLNNIFSITPDKTHEVDCIYSLSANGTSKSFELNTDRNRILVFTSLSGNRIFQSNPTNEDNIYISFINNTNNDDYDLKSLTLTYYPFVENDGKIGWGNSQEFDLLANKESGSITYNGSASGDFIVKPLVTTYSNGKYISKEGKYVITKKYQGANLSTVSQTFYIDRKSPVGLFDNTSIMIGNNLSITFDAQTLDAQTIVNYVLNNMSLNTNMLHFAWKNSENENFVYKYTDIDQSDKKNFQINYKLYLHSNNLDTEVNNNVLSKGTYILVIYDNSNFDNNGKLDIEKTNQIKLNINVDTKSPQGNFVKNNLESLENIKSTNTNMLSFEFEDSESEFVYNIDLENIVLKQNNRIIFRTTKTEQPTYFNLDSETKIYYISSIGNVFSFAKTQIGNTNRYRYNLTILDPSKNSEALFENGKSLEAVYKLEISYKYDSANYPLISNGQNFGQSSYEMIIDHTPPQSNFLKFIEQDKFLTDAEKEALKSSILNKATDSSINFDNYVFVVKNSPTYLPIDPTKNADKENTSNIDYTDTSNIYTRIYNKFNSNNAQDLQSLVEGDVRFNDQTISRYRFDINAYVDGNRLYDGKNYSSYIPNNSNPDETVAFFANNSGKYYEIIEMDEAGNYTIYTVYYIAPQSDLTLNAEYKTSAGTETTKSNETNLTDANFELTKINCLEKDFLNVTVSINENASNAEIFKLRYLPFAVNEEEFEYFSNLDNLIKRINNIIASYAQTNTYGNVYKIEISNRLGNTLTLINSTPNKEFEIKDYIRNINDSIILTIPNITGSATRITDLKVYPVINGKKSGNPLTKDSDGKLINIAETFVYTFTKNAEIVDNNETNKYDNISVYYFEWTDNFNRTQKIVRYLGEKSESKFTFDDSAFFVIKDGENYTQFNKGIYFEFNSNLYEIKIEYQEYPSNIYNIVIENFAGLEELIDNFDSNKDVQKLDLFDLLLRKLGLSDDEDIEAFKNNEKQIKFIVTLTDLTKLDDNEALNSVFSYTYYSFMPNFEFTDSSSNVLQIQENNIISTSKNVHLSFVNNTKFNITSILVERDYVQNNQNQKETFEITSTDYTFSLLGSYKIVITNELGKQKIFQFNITTATNKTYTVMTNEDNMTNFEVVYYGITENITPNDFDETKTFEVYYSIYNTEVVVNSDFNLTKEVLTCNDEKYKDYKLYAIVQKNGDIKDAYKYVAIKKVDYNTNFLNINNENSSLNIYEENKTDDNLISTITGYTISSANGVNVSAPLYNGAQNKIVIKVYYNNELINLNSNIYEVNENNQILNLTNVPAGIYSVYFEDYAGNTQLFNGNTFLNLAILTEIAIKINGEIPVDYQIYNNNVNLSIIDERQYISSSEKGIKIEAYLNNKKIDKIVKDASKNYIFSEYGFYKVIITGYVPSLSEVKITKEIHFTILNNYEALKNFSFVSLNGQNITKVIKDGTDVTTELKRVLALYSLLPLEIEKNDAENNADEANKVIYSMEKIERLKTLLSYDEQSFASSYLYNLNLSSEILYPTEIKYTDGTIYPEIKDVENKDIEKINMTSYLGGGDYEIFVNNQNMILGETEFSFKVWIRDKNAKIKINSTLVEGGETTKEITLSYNPYLIYSQIGECSLYINDTLITKIDRTSLNEVNTYKIAREYKGTYIVQVKSASGNTELSFVLNKKEPLSTVSIIVIVLACLIVAGGVFLFIKLRTKMKVK